MNLNELDEKKQIFNFLEKNQGFENKIVFKAWNGFPRIFIPIIAVKMKLRIKTKKYVAD